jgi:hypothetical protein
MKGKVRLRRLRSVLRNLKYLLAGARRKTTAVDKDPLLALRGSGKDLWADEHADEYVRRLREW